MVVIVAVVVVVAGGGVVVLGFRRAVFVDDGGFVGVVGEGVDFVAL